MILTLLQGEPANGYRLLVRLQRLFAPNYEPSTGSVYPALAALEVEGHIRSTAEGRTRAFEITPRGAALLDSKVDVLAEVEHRTGRTLRATESVDAALARFGAAVKAMQLSPDELSTVLQRTLRSLRRTKRESTT